MCVLFFLQVMDGSLPTSLKHIISNAEYYGPSLFLLGEFMHFRKALSCLRSDLYLRNAKFIF